MGAAPFLDSGTLQSYPRALPGAEIGERLRRLAVISVCTFPRALPWAEIRERLRRSRNANPQENVVRPLVVSC